MAVNISARPSSLTINGIERKQNFVSISIPSNEVSDNAVIQTGSITLRANYSEIRDFTYLASPTIDANWARGAEVIYQISGDDGTLTNYGVYYILKEPDAPNSETYEITIEIGDILALLSYRSANVDASGITAGVETARNTVIERYLARAGASYSISSIPYPFYFPQPKANQDSFVDTAAKMARASNHILYVGRDGIVRNKAISLTGAAIATFTISEDEQLFLPNSTVETPVDVLTIAGLSTLISNSSFPQVNVSAEYVNQTFIYNNGVLGLNLVSRNLRYLPKRTTVTDYGWDGVQEKATIYIESSNLIYEALYLLETNPLALLVPSSLQTNIKRYDAKHRLIEETQETDIWIADFNFTARNKFNNFQSALNVGRSNDTDIRITYTYNDRDQIISRRTETTTYSNAISNGVNSNAVYGRVAKEEVWTANTYSITNYYQDGDLVLSRDGFFQIQLNNNWLNASTTIVYARDSSTQPPATSYRIPYTPTETPITAVLKATPFAGDSYRQRSQPKDVDFLETVQQATEYGQTYLALLYGRRYGFSFGTAINSNLLNNLTPLSRIDVIWRGVIYECLADAISFIANIDKMIIGFNLIVLRTALIDTPTVKNNAVASSIPIEVTFYEEPTALCRLSTDLFLGAIFYEEPYAICTISTDLAISVTFYEEPTATCTISTAFSWATLSADGWENITAQEWSDLTP